MTPPFWLAGSYSEAVLRHGNKLNSFWTTTACDTVQKRNVSLFDSKIMQVKSQLTEFLVQFCCVMLLCYWGPRSSSEGIFEAHSVTTNILCHTVTTPFLRVLSCTSCCPCPWLHLLFEPFTSTIVLAETGEGMKKVARVATRGVVDVWTWPKQQYFESSVSCDCSFQHEGFEYPFRKTSTNTKATEVG